MTKITTGASIYQCRQCGQVLDNGEANDPTHICNRCFVLALRAKDREATT